MVDIHTHILNNIDDGSKSLNESISILKQYEKEKIDKIVLTPHYIENSEYSVQNEEKRKKFELLKEEVKRQNINVELFLANEVYLSNNILTLLKEDKIMTINNSRYLLIEFPMVNEDPNALNIIYNLKLSGITPVIAHPERYIYVQENIDKVLEYINLGALLQVNKGSLFKKYGKDAYKTVKKLIKRKLVYFIASDVHSMNGIYSTKKTIKKLKKITSKDYIKEVLEKNGLNVLNNVEIG